MYIALTQKKNTDSIYQDELFKVYNFPKDLRIFIHEGDRFVYHQPHEGRHKPCYYGCGTIGKITPDGRGKFDAELKDTYEFINNVPIQHPEGGYIEQLGIDQLGEKASVRKDPPFTKSIRKVSETAFLFILKEGLGLGESAAERLLKNPREPLLSEQQCENDIEAETTEDYPVKEGSRQVVYTTRYERKAKLRTQAIRHHGTSCMACGFNFTDKYGKKGEGYIEVHHIKPLASSNEEIEVDPKTDLVVVCSNCHRMIHRKKNEVLSLEELREIIRTTTV